MEFPKGRRLRSCDAVAVSVYSVEDRLLAALFKPREVEVLGGTGLSEAAVRELGAAPPGAPPARSEGTGLTPGELEILRSLVGEGESETGTESGCDLEAEDLLLPDSKAQFIQANGSSYRAVAIHSMVGGVGLGISCAFGTARECKGRHAVFLLSAGHFAACIFDGRGRVEQHRTCRRYAVRGKQGGAQGSHDKKSGKARSIGAQMRREGEKKLAEDVRRVMLEWAEPLRKCDAIFVSCPPARRSTLLGEALQPGDPRLRRVPFAGVGKPSMTACITAHSLICSALFFRSWPSGAHAERLPSFRGRPAQQPLDERDGGPPRTESTPVAGLLDEEGSEGTSEDGRAPAASRSHGRGLEAAGGRGLVDATPGSAQHGSVEDWVHDDELDLADGSDGSGLVDASPGSAQHGPVASWVGKDEPLEAEATSARRHRRPKRPAQRAQSLQRGRGTTQKLAPRVCDDAEVLEAAILEAQASQHPSRTKLLALVLAVLGAAGMGILHRYRSAVLQDG
uniref:VLRF1 domain-containing protein n=1 Tax=Alexandrium catenella TaxID=2925 RepID=A0A7S1PZC7_ALECA